MSGYQYDLITLGAGSGGTRASRIAAQSYKAKVATVELPFDWVASDTTGGAGGTYGPVTPRLTVNSTSSDAVSCHPTNARRHTEPTLAVLFEAAI